MTELNSKHQLKQLLFAAQKSHRPIFLALGALKDCEEDVGRALPNSQDYFHLQDPSIKPVEQSEKQCAVGSVEKMRIATTCVRALYSNPASPFHHGFTRYHYGIMVGH
jgi:hypothetical protein